jgi:hypothetical protein
VVALVPEKRRKVVRQNEPIRRIANPANGQQRFFGGESLAHSTIMPQNQ